MPKLAYCGNIGKSFQCWLNFGNRMTRHYASAIGGGEWFGMPRRPTGRTTMVIHVAIDERDDRVAAAYGRARGLSKSTVYAQAMTWYLDHPEYQCDKEVLSDMERRAMERRRR